MIKLNKNYIIEDLAMLKGANLFTLNEKSEELDLFSSQSTVVMNEAFKAGSSIVVMTKLMSIISRRIGTTIDLAEVPLSYSNNFGNFTSYMGLFGDEALRVNFALGKSDKIVSVDFYKSVSDLPDVTIEFGATDNIVQITNAIEDVVKNGVRENPLNEKLEERTNIADAEEAILSWILSNERVNEEVIQNSRLSNVYKYDYFDWARNNDRPNLSLPTFMKVVKKYLDDQNKSNKFLYNAKIKGDGGKETTIVTDTDSKSFLQAMELSANEKYEQLQSFLSLLSQDMTTSVIVSGRAGTGKSFNTYKYLDDMGLSYKRASGGFKSVKDMYMALWRARDSNEILVLDDFPADRKDIANILKGALDPDSGLVTYLDKDFIPYSEWKELSPEKQAKKIPSTFQYQGKLVFLTNVPISKINAALVDRALVSDLNMTNAEMLGKIKGSIEKFPPTVDVKFKIEAMEFLINILDSIKNLTYRMFEKVCAFSSTQHPKWQAWALNALRVEGKGGF